MFSSNQQKMRVYYKDLLVQKHNDHEQQKLLDKKRAEDLGIETQANKYTVLGNKIIDNITNKKPDSGYLLLLDFIKNRKLSELFNDFKKIPPNDLTKDEKKILDNLNDINKKESFNQEVKNVSSEPEKVAELVYKKFSPVKSAMDGMVEKTDDLISELKKKLALKNNGLKPVETSTNYDKFDILKGYILNKDKDNINDKFTRKELLAYAKQNKKNKGLGQNISKNELVNILVSP